ncbi:hypothetical protein D3C86_1864050 [compost metagenome]
MLMLQGRYWLPVVVPTLLAAFAGLLHLVGQSRRRAAAGLVAVIALLFNALCLLRLIERYYV